MRDERPANLIAKDVDQANVKPCAYCGGPLSGKDGRNLNVYRVTIDSLIIDPGAMRSLGGLTMMLGNERLASVFNPDPKLLKCFGTDAAVICFDCYCTKSAAAVAEAAIERAKAEAAEATAAVAPARRRVRREDIGSYETFGALPPAKEV